MRVFLGSHYISIIESCQFLYIVDFKQENQQHENPNSSNPYLISHDVECNSKIFHMMK